MAIINLPEQFMSMKFAFVCAHCVKLYRGFQKGVNHCGYELHGKDCGGPMGNPRMAFPQYEGVLTRQTIADKCFLCGKPSEKLIHLPENGGFLGACKEHVEMVRPNSSKAMVPVEQKETIA